MKIYIKNIEKYIEVNGSETLLSLYKRLEPSLGFKPICARVNNKNESLLYPLYGPKMVEYLPETSSSGERVYVRSLCMMLYRALELCYPGARLNICHSISAGYFCRLSGVEVTEEVVQCLKSAMTSLVNRDLLFERREELTSDVKEIFRRQGLNDKVRLLDTIDDLYTVYYSLDGLCDSYYGPLAPSTGCLNRFDLKKHHDGFLLFAFSRINPDVPAQPVTQEKMFRAFTDYVAFNNIIGVKNAGELNKATLAGESPTVINVAEALHDKKISGIADEITRRYKEGGARVVMVAGPSSSGKTTFTKRLAIYLMTNLLQPRMISLDNYFVNRELTPKDETGDYDYESLYALDLKLFNDHLRRLIAGETVTMPTYNFELGAREYRGDTLTLNENSILLIEGIHGLNPELTDRIDDRLKYRVYVSALTTLAIDDHNWVPTTDNRLLRRIIRDNKYRGTNPMETIRRWPSVRRGEEKWIFPYQENADSTFNSSLIFELGVMRHCAEEMLKTVPHNVPEYSEAYRLSKFLSYFRPIGEHVIPPTSLLREFLGGSSFRY